jgi:hypothetical protein
MSSADIMFIRLQLTSGSHDLQSVRWVELQFLIPNSIDVLTSDITIKMSLRNKVAVET